MWPSNYLPNTGYPTYPPSYALPSGTVPQISAISNTTTQVPNPSGTTVLIVSNLDSRVEPDNLFTLFGVYGDVLRVKILFNKPDTALIQFVSPQHWLLFFFFFPYL